MIYCKAVNKHFFYTITKYLELKAAIVDRLVCELKLVVLC